MIYSYLNIYADFDFSNIKDRLVEDAYGPIDLIFFNMDFIPQLQLRLWPLNLKRSGRSELVLVFPRFKNMFKIGYMLP